MALNDYKLEFSRVWTNHEDFPTYEAREEVVREDMQCLFDEIRVAFNRFLDELNAGELPFTSSAAVEADNVQAAIENVQQQIASTVAGNIPDDSLTGAKLKEGEIGTRELDDGAVTLDKMAEESVDHPQLCDDAVWGNNIKDGEITQDKFAPGVFPGKADLFEGILAQSQFRLRMSERTTAHATNYVIDPSDMASYIRVSCWDGDSRVIVPADNLFQVGSFVFVENAGGILSVAPASGVTINISGGGYGEYGFRATGEVVLLVKVSATEWVLLPIRAKILRGDIADGAVNLSKTTGIQKEAEVLENIGVNAADWGQIIYDGYDFYKAVVTRTDSLDIDPSKIIMKPYVDGTNTWVANYDVILDNHVRLVDVTDTEFVFYAKTKPPRKVWFEAIVL